jgi:beta-glucosidase/6-phospho-beta-glucosidase/beta-galactosidase
VTTERPRIFDRQKLQFGVATSDHQCEAYDERFEDNMDRWERTAGVTRRGRATDFWNRYQEDIELARGLGCTLFRFSVSWARVEPRPGEFSDENLRHYEAMVDAIHQAGMEPVVTLLHGAWPLHVEDSGSLYAPAWSERFAGYVQSVAGVLGPKVSRWVTINEPTMFPLGYVKPFWSRSYLRAPGLALDASLDMQLAAVSGLIPNLFRANAIAYDSLKSVNPTAVVTSNPYIFGVPRWMQRLLDGRVRRTRAWDDFERRLRSVVQPPPWLRLLGGTPSILNGNWWHVGIAGGLPEDLCPAGCAGKQDAVALDYYWGLGPLSLRSWKDLMAAIGGDYASAPVYPPLLKWLLDYHSSLFPGQPVWVVENGCVERAGRMSRADYLRVHLAQVRAAADGGVPVDAYICWSITTNREWGLPLTPSSDFGLYHIDLDGDAGLRRVETESTTTYRELIETW